MISFPESIMQAAKRLMDRCLYWQVKIVFAESCTGGLIAAAMTEIPGSSDVVERGLVTYSNSAKEQLLGVPKKMIEQHGAVSEQVAIAMAEGALANSHRSAQLSIAVTGVAGPGGTLAKPEGLVYIAAANDHHVVFHRKLEFGPIGRNRVREATVLNALELALECLAPSDQ